MSEPERQSSTQPASIRRRISSRQAADYVGLSEDKMRKLRMAAGGPLFMKIDSRVIYDTADLDTWMESKLRASNNEHGA
jgi:hypothetical protein